MPLGPTGLGSAFGKPMWYSGEGVARKTTSSLPLLLMLTSLCSHSSSGPGSV